MTNARIFSRFPDRAATLNRMTSSTAAAPAPQHANRRQVFAWSLWDWGSAAFNAVATTFVFSVYLTSGLFGDEDEVSADLGTALLIAGIVVAVLAPATGRMADAGGRRKLWLGVNTGVVVLSLAGMVFVAPHEQFLLLGLTLLAVGNVTFEFASVSYNAMLNQISNKRNVGKISGFGWGMGYFGGIVLLALLLVGFIMPEVGWFGVTADESWNVRIAMLVSALWFAVFAIPVFFAVPEIAKPKEKGTGLITAYRDLIRTLADLWKNHRSTLFFLVASAVFRDGLAGVFTFGAVIAAVSFDFEQTQVLIFGVAANVVSGIATVLGGLIEDRVGAKRIIVTSLVGMVVIALTVFFLADQGTWVFWGFGLALTIFVGPVQSASRTYLARVIPPGKEGEIFGLYATTGRAVSFLAPLAFTIAVSWSGETIFGILGIALVLLIGLLLVIPVKAQPRDLG